MKNTKKVFWIIGLIIAIVIIGVIMASYYLNKTKEVKNPIVTMEVEGFGTMKFELYPEVAPENVSNFIALANKGFYNGLQFTRIVKDFMIQGGDKNNDGTGTVAISNMRELQKEETDRAYSVKGEFLANGVDNLVKFDEGVLGAARNDFTQHSSGLTEQSYNSASSQFFIMTEKNYSLNGQYTAFGKITEGLEILQKLETVEVAASSIDENTGKPAEGAEISKPVTPVVIEKISVDTFGIDYGTPEPLIPFDYMTWLYKQYGLDPSMFGGQ